MREIMAMDGSKHLRRCLGLNTFYFIITEPTELKLSEIERPGNSKAVDFFPESFVQIFPQ